MKRNATYLLILIVAIATGVVAMSAYGSGEQESPNAPSERAVAEPDRDRASLSQSTSMSQDHANRSEAPAAPTRVLAHDSEASETDEAKRAAWQTEARQLQDELMQALLRGDADAVDKAKQHAKRLSAKFGR